MFGVVKAGPDKGATSITLVADVSIMFPDPIRKSSVREGSKNALNAKFTYDAPRQRTTLGSSTDLRLSTRYKVVVTIVTRDIICEQPDQNPNLAGNRPKTWKFKARP